VRLTVLPPLPGFDLVLCGSSGEADLERHAVRAARSAGVRCAVWLDHWVNYPGRFVLDGTTVLPDELWVADEHAQRLARATVPGPPVMLRGNPYLDDAVAAIRALTRAPEPGERVLYVTDATAVDAAMLRRYLEHLARAPRPPVAVRVRSHPAQAPATHGPLLAEFGPRLAVAASAGTSLAQDCAWADTVVGCDTMAMVVALKAGRRVVSVLPRAGPPLSLPFAGIERLDLSLPSSNR
jgi:hypothetical protein